MDQYKEYLKTPRWGSQRKIFLRLWEDSCALCCSPIDLHVHHRNYERLGREKVTDAIVLCGRHHAQFHGKPYKKVKELKDVLKQMSVEG